MLTRHKKPKFSCSYPLYSEEIISQEVVINGHTHLMGERKLVDISCNDYAEKHFPNPKDYTLDNLIKAGATLDEVPSPYAGLTPNNLTDEVDNVMNILSNDDNFKTKE